MRIGIIGQPCIDEIFHREKPTEKPVLALGGVLYSYAAMERLIQANGSDADWFEPLTWHSRQDAAFINSLLDKLPHLERESGLWPTDALTNRVQLVYYSSGERAEGCPNALPELTPEQLTPEYLGQLDGLFVNMISGFDVSIETLEAGLNKAAKRPFIHLDVHALVLGDLSQPLTPGQYGKGREPRGVKNWRHWLEVVDSVQLNEFETRWLGYPEVTSEGDLLDFARQHGPWANLKFLIVTRGARGATLHDLKSGEIHHAAPPKVNVANATGSGDVFGSAFLYSTLRGSPPPHALKEAVRWATWSATLPSVEQILNAPAP
ncbi:MAG: carbohydrate kinase family protein [Bacteroidota bacterium]|nr:carbohydrate kinase family protein [Bacteroidota bacterium]MDP4233887.1 carbohydrate kinase family protein [Bacteroidota bacterium]MDP4243559.1 carbohydrate kinase family protein [Bacteroidota bacterium]MDP4288901.1 carbohydrate kinase family protein [Bacteroidota bacterium]